MLAISSGDGFFFLNPRELQECFVIFDFQNLLDVQFRFGPLWRRNLREEGTHSRITFVAILYSP